MAVVSDDVIFIAIVHNLECGEPLHDVIDPPRTPTALLDFKSYFERRYHCVGEGFAGDTREFSRKLICSFTLDAQRHGTVLPEEGER